MHTLICRLFPFEMRDFTVDRETAVAAQQPCAILLLLFLLYYNIYFAHFFPFARFCFGT